MAGQRQKSFGDSPGGPVTALLTSAVLRRTLGGMEEVLKYKHCFVCGDEHPTGLKAKFLYDGEKVITEITADRQFEGYAGIYHGGIISTLLDEVMIKAILAEKKYAVTAELTVRYHRPVRVGDHVKFHGRVTEQKGRMYITAGEAFSDDGRPFATATGKYIEAKPSLRNELLKSVG